MSEGLNFRVQISPLRLGRVHVLWDPKVGTSWTPQRTWAHFNDKELLNDTSIAVSTVYSSKQRAKESDKVKPTKILIEVSSPNLLTAFMIKQNAIFLTELGQSTVITINTFSYFMWSKIDIQYPELLDGFSPLTKRWLLSAMFMHSVGSWCYEIMSGLFFQHERLFVWISPVGKSLFQLFHSIITWMQHETVCVCFGSQH